jgi:hypothetical protein
MAYPLFCLTRCISSYQGLIAPNDAKENEGLRSRALSKNIGLSESSYVKRLEGLGKGTYLRMAPLVFGEVNWHLE